MSFHNPLDSGCHTQGSDLTPMSCIANDRWGVQDRVLRATGETLVWVGSDLDKVGAEARARGPSQRGDRWAAFRRPEIGERRMGPKMSVGTPPQGDTHAERGTATAGEGSATRRRILHIALTLMAQRGVDGTSMRDLASAAGLNVASLYHYFPSKRDLLESVLVEQGFSPVRAPRGESHEGGAGEPDLAQLLADILVSMFEVQDFVRLMVGEAMRGESTARTVGLDLFTSFQQSMEEWMESYRPDLVERSGAGE